MIDIGCGDGTFTAEVFERARPAYMAAVDPSSEAIRIANEKKETRAIEFAVQSAYELPWPDDAFDVACIRCALHHMERPIDALREALRIAPLIIGIEPNGYNPVLKILEKVSPYHIEHEERSYRPAKLDSWLAGLGAVVTRREWIGLVPMFSPDWFARFFKMFEPVVERIPVVNRICCAQYVFVADRRLAR
jgi:SAM-dependent methyltransferase